jgi:pyruvate dehydrogenase E2 component (dihydrolipoamide acetyltransferase)
MGEHRKRLTAMRKFIGKSLTESVTTIPQARSYVQTDVTNLLKLKSDLRTEGKNASFTGLFVKAVVESLKLHPHLNSWIEDNEVVTSDQINPCVAMQGGRGLYVPVIHGAQDMNAGEITATIRALSQKISDGTIKQEDMTDGTVTINSDGTGRTEIISSILNRGQCLLIGVGRTKKQPVVLDDNAIGVRDMAWVTYVMNHIIVDGIIVSRFTDTLTEILENPCESLSF